MDNPGALNHDTHAYPDPLVDKAGIAINRRGEWLGVGVVSPRLVFRRMPDSPYPDQGLDRLMPELRCSDSLNWCR